MHRVMIITVISLLGTTANAGQQGFVIVEEAGQVQVEANTKVTVPSSQEKVRVQGTCAQQQQQAACVNTYGESQTRVSVRTNVRVFSGRQPVRTVARWLLKAPKRVLARLRSRC